MRRLAVAATAALMFTLSACGSGSGSTQSATQLIAASADKATEAKTARMSGEVSFDLGGEHKTLPLDGVLDFGTGAYEFTYDMSQLGLPGAAGLKIKARIVEGVMYLDFGDLARSSSRLSAITGGKSWAKLDFRALLGPNGAGGLADTNPTGTLDALRGAGRVTKVGTDTLRGVETTHYRAMVDPAKALEQAPADLRSKIKQGLAMFKGPLPVEVWVDGDGQARKIAMDIPTPAGKASVTMEYYDFGVAVNVQAPPADDVFDLSQLTGGTHAPAGTGTPAI